MKIAILTLGCKVNKYESDALEYELNLKGFKTTDCLEPADIYVINTCAVTQEAEKKSRQMIARCRKFNKHAKIFICGCASQHNQKQFLDKYVEYVCGTAGKYKIAKIIEEISKNHNLELKNHENIDELPLIYEDGMHAKQNRTRAYIKIQDGCNNFCSYCIIPYLRGRSRSRPIFSIINEVASLDENIKEIVLTGINVTDYKIDGEKKLGVVLEELNTMGKRLRLGSVEDTIIDEEFVKKLASLENFCPHFHLSLQSGSASVLKRMNRHYTPQQFANSVKLIRKYFANAGITTDVIVGFPEETEEEFEETYKFIKEVGFSQLHIFQYSQREGTVASKIYKDMDSHIKQERSEKLEQLNKKLKLEFLHKNKGQVNKMGNVLIEEKIDDHYVGYTENYIRCYVKSKEDITGKIVNVKIRKPFKDGAEAKIIKKNPISFRIIT